MTTTAAPYDLTNRAFSRNSSSPSFKLMELTIPLPCMHCNPASITSHFDESIIIGTRLISGSDATRFINSRIRLFESSIPSSRLISIICAPLITCCRATCNASSSFPSLISFENFGEPVTFVLSPTLTKFILSSMCKGSNPLSRQCFLILGILLGGYFSLNFLISLMCSGVVPQQPP